MTQYLNVNADLEWCDTCNGEIPVIDRFHAQAGYEERATEYYVTALDCGHDIEVRQ